MNLLIYIYKGEIGQPGIIQWNQKAINDIEKQSLSNLGFWRGSGGPSEICSNCPKFQVRNLEIFK